MKDEDEHALQGVEDGEQVGHDDRALVDIHQAKRPGQAQQTQQGYGSDHPGPEHTTKKQGVVKLHSVASVGMTTLCHKGTI